MCYTGSLEQKTPPKLLSLFLLRALFGMHELFWLHFAKPSKHDQKREFFRNVQGNVQRYG